MQEYVCDKIMNEGTRTVSKTKLGKDTVLRLVVISPSISANDLMETVGSARTIANEYMQSFQTK